MEWVTRLRGQIVGLDTAPLIFYIEEHSEYVEVLDPFFSALAQGEFRAVTSTVTLLEVLVHPLRNHDEALAHQYNDILLSSEHISTLPVTFAVAQDAAELRSQYNLKTPDAIQIATAIGNHAKLFLANDRRIPEIAGISVLRLDEIRT